VLQHPTCSAQYRNLSHGIGAGEASCILPSSAGSDHGGAQFEHSSLPGTIKNLFNLTSFLTKRDAWAGDVSELLTEPAPRTDAPMHLPDSHPPAKPWDPPPSHARGGDGTRAAAAPAAERARRRLASSAAQGSAAEQPRHCSITEDDIQTCSGPEQMSTKQRNQMRVLAALTGRELPPQLDGSTYSYAAANRWLATATDEFMSQK
jgi:hypothetical protein